MKPTSDLTTKQRARELVEALSRLIKDHAALARDSSIESGLDVTHTEDELVDRLVELLSDR